MQVATLKDFSVWFCRRFARVEAAHEAKSQIEVKCGQTQAGEHYIQAFKDWLEKLPEDLDGTLAATTHIEHFLASLSPLVPSELEDSYDPPRKTLIDEHTTEHNGAGFDSLTDCMDRREHEHNRQRGGSTVSMRVWHAECRACNVRVRVYGGLPV